MGKPSFKEIEHTADWSLHIQAEDMRGLLFQAAQGMFQLMQLEGEAEPLSQRCLEVEAQDREGLLVAWLEELLFLIETGEVALVLEKIKVSDDERHLEAIVEEYRISGIEKEIKAVTYHGLQVRDTASGLEATVVFDV